MYIPKNRVNNFTSISDFWRKIFSPSINSFKTSQVEEYSDGVLLGLILSTALGRAALHHSRGCNRTWWITRWVTYFVLQYLACSLHASLGMRVYLWLHLCVAYCRWIILDARRDAEKWRRRIIIYYGQWSVRMWPDMHAFCADPDKPPQLNALGFLTLYNIPDRL